MLARFGHPPHVRNERGLEIRLSSVRGLCTALLALVPAAAASSPVHTSYLWHMHQPIYWPERSTWNGQAYEHAYETLTLGHSQSDVFGIFNKDDRVHDYQDYPETALAMLLDLPDAGAQISFAGSLIQNVTSLAAAGWNGGRYAPDWHRHYREAMSWTTSGGRPRLEAVLVAFHHPIAPLLDPAVFRRMIQAQKAIMPATWAGAQISRGFFPAEMCFSERLIPILVEEGVDWTIVADIHIARACADYPSYAALDNCDPPNHADRINPPHGFYQAQSISRGVTTRIPVPFGWQPHRAQYVDPETGAISSLVVVPAANAMSWNEGYSLYGTGEIDAIAPRNDPARPMLILFAHDGDNDWAGGFSYYHENVSQFAHAAAARGYEPTTVAEYLADHPVPADDLVHVEDGGWVNADGDFGSPQFINWNWPLVDATGAFDIPNGWAEDERNWAVLTAATNRVLTAEGNAGDPDMARVVDPTRPGTTTLERAWHFLLAGFESGAMYYGTSLDFEIKPTLAANRAVEHADSILRNGLDRTAPTVWLPQRLPWNPGGRGAGSLWGYPSGAGAPMSRDFHVWTFVHDVSGVDTVRLWYRVDADGANPLSSTQNETYAGGAEVGPWRSLGMNRRAFPAGNLHDDPDIDFSVMPSYIADQYWVLVSGLSDALVDYYVEAVDVLGNVCRGPIQHVYVGDESPDPRPAASWDPPDPVAGGVLAIRYDPVPGTLPDDVPAVFIHIGHSGWTEILAPDPAMTYDAGSARWTFTYAIPPSATSVDFVFHDGAGLWDNNHGSDWHVLVSGGVSPGHAIDGTLDAGLSPVASCGGNDLYADYDGRFLYVAAPAVGATSLLDHFVLVAGPGSSPPRPAPWAKSGTVTGFDLMLGNEDGNNWAGWFDSTETLATVGVRSASGTALEGLVDVVAAWGTAPESLRVAFAAYDTPDGGALALQAPCGDANGNLDAAEWIVVAAGRPVSVPAAPRTSPGPAIRLLSQNPTRGAFRALVEGNAPGTVTVDLLDVGGRLVRRLHEGVAAGRLEIAARLGESGREAAGVYFLVARSEVGVAARRLAYVP